MEGKIAMVVGSNGRQICSVAQDINVGIGSNHGDVSPSNGFNAAHGNNVRINVGTGDDDVQTTVAHGSWGVVVRDNTGQVVIAAHGRSDFV